MTKIERIQNKLESALRQVEQLEREYAELKQQALQQVKVSKTGETTTLTFGSRVLKVKRNSHWRLNVYENGSRIVSDYMFGINELRFAISQNLIVGA
jgi:intein-encoded DNA endonuclease-like protein